MSFLKNKIDNLRERIMKFYNRTADYMLMALLKIEESKNSMTYYEIIDELVSIEKTLIYMEKEPWKYNGKGDKCYDHLEEENE